MTCLVRNFFKALQRLDACFVLPSGWLAFFSLLFPPPSSLFNNTEVVYSFWMKSQIGYWGCVLELRGPLLHCSCVRSNSSHRSPLVPECSIAQDEAMEADNDATLFTWGHPITAMRGPLINMLKLVVSATNNSLLCRNKKSVHAACLEWLWGQTQTGHLNFIITFPPRKERGRD